MPARRIAASCLLSLLICTRYGTAGEATIDRAAAAKVAAIGERAAKEGQEATARRILERAIELDPNHSAARARLGYRRSGKEWRAPAATPLGEDSSPAAAGRFLEELRAAEDRWATAYVRAGLKEHYLDVLARLPRNEEVHKALGHEKIGTRYVRPELVAATRRFEEQEQRRREFAAPGNIEETASPRVPGVAMRATFRAGERRVSGTLSAEDLQMAAGTAHAAHAFLRDLFGEPVQTWGRPDVVFLPREDYERCVTAAFPPGEERDRWLKKALMRTAELAVFVADGAERASDTYAHAVAILSAEMWSSPANDPERRLYAWFCEGLGYFASMALFKTGMTYYTGQGSSAKIPPTVPPPERRDREGLLAWLQGQVLDGTTEPIRDVCGRTINSLDLLLSLEAWSFLEVLAAYDPEGLRKLPAALRAQQEGAFADRSGRAIEASFGKGFAELEPLWRAFVLEIM